MPHPLEENPLTKLPFALWSTGRGGGGKADQSASGAGGVRLPRTIVFEYNFPKAMYFTPRTGGADAADDEMLAGDDAPGVHRLAGKDIDTRAVVDLLSHRAAGRRRRIGARRELPAADADDALDFNTMYVALEHPVVDAPSPTSSPSPRRVGTVDPQETAATTAATTRVTTQYLSPLGLKYFMQGASVLSAPAGSRAGEGGGGGGSNRLMASSASSASSAPDSTARRIMAEVRLVEAKDGILQWMPPSGCPHSEVIEAVWTRHMLVCEKLRNVHQLKDHSLSNFDRAATFDGPPNMSTRKFVAPAVQDGIRGQLHDALRRVAAFVPGQRVVDATMYFRVDAGGTLWLLFCTRLRLGPVPAPEAAPAVRAGRIAHAIAQHTAADTGGFVHTGPRPLSLVEFSEADVQRDFMLRQMTSATEALKEASKGKSGGGGGGGDHGGVRRSSSVAALLASRPATSGGKKRTDGPSPTHPPVPFAVPAESKMVLLTGLTRRATKFAKETPWHQLAQTNLAVESGIARTRTRQEFDRVDLSAECFRPKPVETRCLDRDPTAPRLGTPARSRLAKPMRWLNDPDIELTAHRYSSAHTMLGGRARNSSQQRQQQSTTRRGTSTSTPPALSTAQTPQRSPHQQQPTRSETPLSRAGRKASIVLPDPLASEADDDDTAFRGDTTADAPPAVPLAERLAEAEATGRQPETCLSVSNATEWLAQLRATATAHFRTSRGHQPFALSLPSVLFPDPDVADALLKLLKLCEFEACDVAAAVEADAEVHRMGVIDELSYHHQHYVPPSNFAGEDDGASAPTTAAEDGGDAIGTVQCFLAASLRPVLLLSSHLDEFENRTLAELLPKGD